MQSTGDKSKTKIKYLFVRFVPHVYLVARQAALSGFLVIAAPLIAAALLWALRTLVDDVLISGKLDLLPVCLAIYLGLALAKVTVEYLIQRTEATVVEAVVKSLRIESYAHVISQSPGSFEGKSTADILNRLSGDTDRTEYLIYTGPLALLADGAAAVFFTVFLLYLSWPLTLATLLVVPAFVWASAGLALPIRRAARLSREGQSRWMSLAEERIGAGPVVHAFNGISGEVRAFALSAERARWAELKMRVLQAWQSALVEIASVIGGLVVIAVGAHQITSGRLTVGSLLAFAGTVGSLYAPLRSLAKLSGRFQNSAVGAERLASLLDTRSLVSEKPAARRLTATRGSLSFCEVGFTYPGGQRVLDNISLAVEPGETVALVGPSGAGKSTLVRLALRLLDPTEGHIEIDGVDIRDVTLASLREAIVPVFQEPYVIGGTISGNIAYAAPDASAAAITAAARAASVDQFATRERGGLAGRTGRQGTSLSGGQRQRIALARALLRDAPILLLDEAVAAVESETEELIQEALEKLGGRRTIVTVAHRLSSIRKADRIVVIEKGRIVEMGSPTELLTRPSRCRELFGPQISLAQAAE